MGRESGHGFLFQLFFLRSLNYRIIKINLEDIAVNFWSSWKRNHKMSDYNQQSVITAERIRPILKKPDPTPFPSWTFLIEKGVSQYNPNMFSVHIGLRKYSAGRCLQMTDIHRWRVQDFTVLLIPPGRFC